MSGSEGS